jgi:GT2 family glycosyltransferase
VSGATKVSIIIPHLGGQEVLTSCLQALQPTISDDVATLVVDNGSTDGSVAAVQERFPWVEAIRSERNLGFAGGCNLGIRSSRSEYVILLNDDTEVAPGWLQPLREAAERNPKIGACQPKLLSTRERERFDYSGAAGGLIDYFGYPFAMGRLFESIEKDSHQYDSSQPIFWASGTAMLLRRSALDEVGLLDDSFFAHMEEIDLCWRLHLRGYQVWSVPQSVVFHRSGATLAASSFRKKYLNHRNNLVMLLKNYDLGNLLSILPIRFALEALTLLYSAVVLDFGRVFAVLAALSYLLTHPRKVWYQRRQAQAIRSVPDRMIQKQMFRGSIVCHYFIKRVRRAADLRGLPVAG